jgi:hypothetical protein
VFHPQDIVQYGGVYSGMVRSWNLHFFDFIKVRPYSIEWVAESASDAEDLTFSSNGYSRNMGVSSNWKALLLNKVVVGNGKKLTQIDTTIIGPPPGYDSVSTIGIVYQRRHR